MRAVMSSERRTLGAFLGVVLMSLTACSASGSDGGLVSGATVDDPDGMHGTVLTEPYSFPDASLTATDGQEVALRTALDEPLTLVFFGYTHCPDICQAVMANLASAAARLDDGEAERLQVWFVTTDPARDDAATLRRYLDRFDPAFEGFTGPLPEIVATARAVHVPVEKGARLPTGGYEVNHGTPVLGVVEDGSVPIVWTEGTSAAQLADDITQVLDEGPPSLAPEDS